MGLFSHSSCRGYPIATMIYWVYKSFNHECDPYSLSLISVSYFIMMIMTFAVMFISIAIHFAPRIYALEFWFILQSLITQDRFFRILDWTCYHRLPLYQIWILN